MKDLVLISRQGVEDQGKRLLELAEWMGVGARQITLDGQPAPDQLSTTLGNKECVAIGAETLEFLRKLWPPGVLQALMQDRCAHLLVFSVDGSQRHTGLLDWLTGGAVTGLAPPDRKQNFHFPEPGRKFSGAFAGQSFALKQRRVVSSFEVGQSGGRGLDRILLADDRPVFLRMEQGPNELFLLSLAQVPDISERLSQSQGVEEYHDQLAPLLIFLRHCFGEMCWHGIHRTGRLIIDDPLLTQAYGYLNFAALRRSMRSAGYGATVAFIPWNHWRSSKTGAVKIFDGSPDLSVCVHGCDHTNKEFEDVDPGSLQWKTDTALQRMERHKTRTGVAFEPVMVFPQGKFSRPSISALRASGYLAAVNTTCFPSYGEAEPLTIADFLRPAIMKFDGFPVFQRRYPRLLMDFAFDAFLGKPVLIVQHHDDFREGYRPFEEFVAGLHKLEPVLSWGPLSEQLVESCMVRSVSECSMEVRFFTRQFRFKNAQTGRTAFRFSKEEPSASAVSNVLVDGVSVAFSIENGLLTFEHQVGPGQTVDVRVLDRPARPVAHKRPDVTHTVNVSLRRALSEFRDNTLTRYPRLMTAATALATRMKVTGNDNRKKQS
jgi:hypothetical protein